MNVKLTFIYIYIAKQSEDDQAFTVLLECNRQAEVLKGLQLSFAQHVGSLGERFRRCRHVSRMFAVSTSKNIRMFFSRTSLRIFNLKVF